MQKEYERSVGESVTLQWDITKGSADRFAFLDLFANFGSNVRLIFNLNSETQLPKSVEAANQLFGKRISVKIEGSRYLLTLEKLNFTDSVPFKLEGQTRNGRNTSKIDLAIITLTVQGM